MKISIYELLGLIKDGKAPKKIRVCGEVSDTIFTFDKNVDVYYDDDCNTLGYKYNLEVMLDSEIEIIEEVEDKEYEDIGELCYNTKEFENDVVKLEYCSRTMQIGRVIVDLSTKIDALIRNQKYILEQLSKEGNNE